MANSYGFDQQANNLNDYMSQMQGGGGISPVPLFEQVNSSFDSYIPVTLSGDPVSFESDWQIPIKVTAQIDPVQSGSGVPSPDNVRPISGWTEAEIHNTSDHYISVTWQDTAGTVYGGSITINEDGSGDLVADWMKQKIGQESVFSSLTVGNIVRVTCQISQDSVVWGKVDQKSGMIICDMFPESTNNDTFNGEIGVHLRSNNTHYAVFGLGTLVPDYPSGVDYLKEIQPTIIYKLDIPLTYHLGNVGRLYSLIGQNNVWADTGPVTVTYKGVNPLFIPDPLHVGVFNPK